MIAKACLRYHRLSAKKVREIARLVRGKDVEKAFAILTSLNKNPRFDVAKLLKSAVANAKVKGLEEKQLYISKLVANNGPVYKRYRAEAFGRASVVKKPLCHVDLELELKVDTTPAPKPKTKSKIVKKVQKKKEISKKR